MGLMVVNGAQMQCSFGTSPASLLVLAVTRTLVGLPAASIMNNIPFLNILPFGMCSTAANPMVAAATAAALGVPTPAPCIPITVAPWLPGHPRVSVGRYPALTDSCRLMCLWGGMISLTSAGQTKVQL